MSDSSPSGSRNSDDCSYRDAGGSDESPIEITAVGDAEIGLSNSPALGEHLVSRAEDADGRPSTVRRVAGSALVLATQYGVTTILTALTTIAITRLLEPTGYGIYGSAIAAWTLLGATADLGTTSVLARDLGENRATYRPRLYSAYAVAGSWSTILALVLAALAVASGLGHERSQALLVLAPSMMFNAFNPASSVFMAAYETKTLLKINVASYAVQGIVSAGLAASGGGPVAVAAGVSSTSAVFSVVIALAAQRLLPAKTPEAVPMKRSTLLRQSVPLAVLGVLTRVYGMLDLVLLGWYITGPRLGDYAAASKVLTVFAGLAGQVMAGALPGLAVGIREDKNVSELSARVCHWLMVSAMPMFLGVGLFPSLVVRLALGSRYDAATGLIQILAAYGILAVGTNLAGNVLVAARRMRPLYIQSVVAIAINVGANVLLIPKFGVYASAWITVGTEAFVCVSAFYFAREFISLPSMFRVAWRPAISIAVAAVLGGVVARSTEAGGVAVFVLVLPVALVASRSWPEEFSLPRLRRA